MDQHPVPEQQIITNPKYLLKADRIGGEKLTPDQRRQDKMIGAMVRKLPRVLLLDSIVITPQERMVFSERFDTKRVDHWRDIDIEQALSALPLPTMQEENIRQPVNTFKRFEGTDTLQRRMRRVVSLVTRGTPATPDVVNPYDLYNFVKNKCRNAVAFERKIPEILQALDTAGLGAGNYHEAVNEIGVTLFGSQWVYLQQLRLVEAVVTGKRVPVPISPPPKRTADTIHAAVIAPDRAIKKDTSTVSRELQTTVDNDAMQIGSESVLLGDAYAYASRANRIIRIGRTVDAESLSSEVSHQSSLFHPDRIIIEIPARSPVLSDQEMFAELPYLLRETTSIVIITPKVIPFLRRSPLYSFYPSFAASQQPLRGKTNMITEEIPRFDRNDTGFFAKKIPNELVSPVDPNAITVVASDILFGKTYGDNNSTRIVRPGRNVDTDTLMQRIKDFRKEGVWNVVVELPMGYQAVRTLSDAQELAHMSEKYDMAVRFITDIPEFHSTLIGSQFTNWQDCSEAIKAGNTYLYPVEVKPGVQNEKPYKDLLVEIEHLDAFERIIMYGTNQETGENPYPVSQQWECIANIAELIMQHKDDMSAVWEWAPGPYNKEARDLYTANPRVWDAIMDAKRKNDRKIRIPLQMLQDHHYDFYNFVEHLRGADNRKLLRIMTPAG